MSSDDNVLPPRDDYDNEWDRKINEACIEILTAAVPVLEAHGLNRIDQMLVFMMLTTDVIGGQTCPSCRARDIKFVKKTMPTLIKQAVDHAMEKASGKPQSDHNLH
jgi:hypothetical protein